MDNVRLGRRLGIGARLAAKILRERTQSATPSSRPGAVPAPPSQRSPAGETRRSARDAGRAVAQGGRGFTRGFWTPFSSAARALWHEITGVFFALFAAFFLQSLWRTRASWRTGVDHRHFVLYLIFALVFAWFSVAAFRTARRTAR